MTQTPGDGALPDEPDDEATRRAREQPGYWQSEQPPQGVPYPAQEYPPQQYPPQGYPPQGYASQAPMQYAPDHPKATTSLVLGILGVVLCQILGPFAWSIGKRTVTEIDASQGRLGGRGAAQAGYVLGIIGTVLLALGLLWIVVVIAGMGLFMTSSP